MRLDIRENWSSKTRNDIPEVDWKAHIKRREELSKQLQENAEFKASEAAIKAQELWKNARPADDSHPYLLTKNVAPHGLRVEGENLLIPCYRFDDETVSPTISTLQTISPSGEKLFMAGGIKKGSFYEITSKESPKDLLILCEGFATGASIFEATGISTEVCFDAGNLLTVAKTIRAKYPDFKLIIAADDDWKNEVNTGLVKAKETALEVGGYLTIPEFPENRGDKDTDFNDLARLSGVDTVRLQIESASLVEVVKDGVKLICGSILKPEKIDWLWDGWLAMGKLAILAGEPGTGKTTIATHLAATVTTGGRWPDGSNCPEGDILIWSGEDDPSDTLMPRLIAAGANPKRVFFVGDKTVTGESRPFDPAKDIGLLLEEALKLPKLRLMVFDPIVNAVGGDSHKNTEVRRALQPLVDFASKIGASLIGITHFSKGGQGSDPTRRVMGSVAFTAVARVVMVAAKNKDDDGNERRVFARSKSNIGPDDGGFEYSIEQVEALQGIWASRVVWGNVLTGSAKSLLAEHDENDRRGLVADAEDFLRQCLKDGLTPTKTIQAEALNAGISWATVRRASEQLNVLKRKGGMNQGWYWKLQSSEDAQNNRRCSTNRGEHLREKLSTFDEYDSNEPTDNTPPTNDDDDKGVSI
jgi:putative DNA primase/helicase